MVTALVTATSSLVSRHAPRLSRHLVTSTAVAASALTPEPSPPRRARQVDHSKTLIRTAIILNRSPIITRAPTSFERAFFNYQERIRRAFHNPFPYDFYFKPGSILESKFTLEERERERRIFYRGFGADSKYAPKSKLTPEELEKFGTEDGTVMSRKHASDRKGDAKSLDRKGQRNLYLLLSQGEGSEATWRFPEGDLGEEEFLHEAAKRNMYAECGTNVDTWIVSPRPIGHYDVPSSTPPAGQKRGPKTVVFFLKAHIMSGQVHPTNATDFAWLTKEEIGERLQTDKQYWDGVKDMLSDF
ncbi:50S ribosomal subunit L30 [Vararia minispora EC-137]|uniref:50S ribosomal subunit L30 n=1 Tax=Vararia minispora EC-137 TaxID=1314806 RepID=A0ACB8QDF6_9AGAM|nr:50S ribosomal subunit L30 [Vararia minispora EC-137]